MEFFNNKSNNTLKFKLNNEGVDTNSIEARLILVSEGKNYLFFGDIDNEFCTFTIPELQQFEKDNSGKIKFEIISEDIYFPVWEDTFNVNTKVNITLEQVVTDVVEEKKTAKPKISVAQPIVEVVQEEKPKPKVKVSEKIKVDEKDSSTKVKGFSSFKS